MFCQSSAAGPMTRPIFLNSFLFCYSKGFYTFPRKVNAHGRLMVAPKQTLSHLALALSPESLQKRKEAYQWLLAEPRREGLGCRRMAVANKMLPKIAPW